MPEGGKGRRQTEYEIFMRGVNRHKQNLRKRGMTGEAAQVDADLRAAAKKQRAARAASMRPDKIGKPQPSKRVAGPPYVKSSYLTSSNWNPFKGK